MHYNAAYYEGHYGRLLQDNGYLGLRSMYWKAAITAVHPVSDDSLLLDYGCGTGQVSMAFPNTHYYDIAEFSRDLIRKTGRVVYDEVAAIPAGQFDFVLFMGVYMSTIPTRSPRAASATPRLAVSVDLPTPPLPLVIA